MVKLTKEQQSALNSLIIWLKDKNRKPFITLGGYAGTGKTTLMATLRHEIKKQYKELKIAFCSYTGKATRVLKNSLVTQKALMPGDNISTIHSLIYSPVTNTHEEIIGWERKEEIKFGLIIVDEASMIDENIWADLLSYKIPIIAVGDHGQLPPIKGTFNLMSKPDIRLEEIHRQKKDNPIIDLSVIARRIGKIEVGSYGKGITKLSKSDPESAETINEILDNYSPELLILCGYNSTRIKLNKYIRNNMELYSSTPARGDRVICLRNNHEKKIYNGMLGTIIHIDSNDNKTYQATIEFDEENADYKGLILAEQFNNPQSLNFTDKRNRTLKADLFDFGYALTVHKAQGSQAKKVLLFEERFPQMDDAAWKRWLYTAITRAEEELIIIGD